MDEQLIKIRHWLRPVSWLYGLGVWLRNKLFDWGYLRSKSFDIPVLCIGNLTVGGTGKTPHTEYLLNLLHKEKYRIAVLSRGYKRRTKGFLLADENTGVEAIGDEPYQIKEKFPEVTVAVDEDRCHGIEQLLHADTESPIDAILLDDAFQHRYVKAGLNILLTDYHRLFCDDKLLPAGLLRESISGKNRAHIVIVTKCPEDIKPIDFNIITKRLKLFPYQQLYFSSLRYGNLVPVFGGQRRTLASLREEEHILLLTGIASPAPLEHKVRSYTRHIHTYSFADHHHFTDKDLLTLKQRFDALDGKARLIITTEKDAARLRHHPMLNESLKPYIYVLPIEIEILQNQQHIFNQNIIGYVRTHSRNSSLPQR